MTDCPHTIKDAAAELLAMHRIATANKPKGAFKKLEITKKVGCVQFKSNTSLAKIDGKTIIEVTLDLRYPD
jgi:hypothetical protein